MCIITIDNDNDCDPDCNLSLHFISFSFCFANCESYKMNDLQRLHSFGQRVSVRVCVRIIMTICSPFFAGLSAVDFTPPAHSPTTRHDMIAMWIEDRCEMVGQKSKKKKTEWNEMKKEWNNLPNEWSTEKWQGNQQQQQRSVEWGRGYKAARGIWGWINKDVWVWVWGEGVEIISRRTW